MTSLHDRLSIVLLTYNRALEVRHTLTQIVSLTDVPHIILVDNASTDGTVDMVRRRFPQVECIVMQKNIGAAARNAGVQRVKTEYVAFCDDDSWWAPGSLEKAVAVLDAYPRIAALCARILLGPQEKEDPICRVMAHSPLPSAGLPGPALLGFIACAVVFRRNAYLEAGGYDPKFFVGGEEELLTLDLVVRGWSVVYLDALTVHHHPSPQRDNASRQHIVIRNQLWVAWLRLPLATALKETLRICRSAVNLRALKTGVLNALRELPWVVRKRRVIPPAVESLHQILRRQ